MYFYSYPIAAESQAQLTSVSHAHNYLLQVLMEEGLVGALSMLAAATFLLLAAWRVLRARNIEPWLAVIMLGVLAALAGRAADQLGSVGRITDLMLFFALSGTLIAITEIARTGHPTDNEPMNHPSRRERRRQTSSQLRIPALALTAVVAFAAIWLFLAKDVSMMRAGWTAANGFEHSAASEGDPAFLAFNRAVELAPDVERYALEQAKLLRRTAAAAEDPEDEVRLLLLAYEILARYEDRDPYAWVTQRTLATITLRLVTLGDTSRIPEAIARYNVVTELMSAYPSILAEAAAASVELGDMQQALAYSDLAIAGEPSTTILPQAWWARGSALIDGNRVEEAVEAFNTAIERRPRGNYAQLSHLELATILEAAGDEAGATTQRRKAADIY
jgi:tetratricopeptide (TPR) repeat protein